MKNILRTIFLVSCSLTTLLLQAQNRSIAFTEKPWNEILTLAKTGNMMIFLDAYTTWCGPCKWMAANIFTRDSVADLYNSKFICAHFDMEKGEGLTLAQLYQVKAYPTLLFLNTEGEMVHKRVGAPQRVTDYLEMAETALTPGEGLAGCEKRFRAGERDPRFMIRYLDHLQGAYMPLNETLDQYFETVGEREMTARPNWEILFRYVTDVDSKVFSWFLGHRAEYEQLYTRDSVHAKIDNVLLQALTGKLRSRDFTENDYEQLKQKIRTSGYPGAEKVIFTGDLNVFQMKGDMGGFIRLASIGFDRFYAEDPVMLERVAATFLQIASEKEPLEKAAVWAKKSISLAPSPSNHDIYAQLMFKLGNRKEAEKFELRAIEMAREKKLPTLDYEENLKRFRN